MRAVRVLTEFGEVSAFLHHGQWWIILPDDVPLPVALEGEL